MQNLREAGAVWTLGDTDGYRQAALRQAGVVVVFPLNPHRLASQHYLLSLVNQLRTAEPLILWIRLSGPAQFHDIKQNYIRHGAEVLITEQLSAHRHVMIETHRKNPLLQAGIIGQSLLSGALFSQEISWCKLGIRHSDGLSPTNETSLITSFLLPSLDKCDCESKRLHKNKARDHKSIRSFADSVVAVVFTIPDLGQQPKSGVGILSGSQYAGSKTTDNPTPPNIKVSALVSQVAEAFPTDAAEMAKAARDAYSNANDGAKPEVKRKKFQVEQHWDDCGDDLTAIN